MCEAVDILDLQYILTVEEVEPEHLQLFSASAPQPKIWPLLKERRKRPQQLNRP